MKYIRFPALFHHFFFTSLTRAEQRSRCLRLVSSLTIPQCVVGVLVCWIDDCLERSSIFEENVESSSFVSCQLYYYLSISLFTLSSLYCRHRVIFRDDNGQKVTEDFCSFVDSEPRKISGMLNFVHLNPEPVSSVVLSKNVMTNIKFFASCFLFTPGVQVSYVEISTKLYICCEQALTFSTVAAQS